MKEQIRLHQAAILLTLAYLAGCAPPTPITIVVTATQSNKSTPIPTTALPNTATVISTTPTASLMSTTTTARSTLENSITEGGWQVKIYSVKREKQLEIGIPIQRGTMNTKEGFILLLLGIQVAKIPAENQIILCSGDFVVIDSQGNKYDPIGGSNDTFNWFILPPSEGMFQAPYVNSCGEGCTENYTWTFTPDCAWKVTVEGLQWQQTYLYLIPSSASGLEFKFQDIQAMTHLQKPAP